MYNSVISIDAQKDISIAHGYYCSINEELAENFIDQLKIAIDKILKAPNRPKNRFENVKAFKLKKFTYFIYYLTDNENLLIKIIAVLHTAQDTTKVTKRLD